MKCYLCFLYICCVGGRVDYYLSPSPPLRFESGINSLFFQFVPICDQTMNEGDENAMFQLTIQEQDRNCITTGSHPTTNVRIIGENDI